MNTIRKRILYAMSSLGLLLASLLPVTPAVAAACTPPGTDYGMLTQTFSVSSAGTYRIWSRLAAPDASNNTYLLDVDSTSCYTVGGSTVPVYANGATTHFVNNTTNWTSKTSTGTTIDISLSAANHTFKLIGSGQGLVVDRIILTKDTTCTPIGTGDNCASVYFAADIDQNGSINFLDFSRLAAKYNQSSGSLGRVDINGDGTVNFLDFSLMASTYGQ